jgi:NOL1/NOP2/fmu family ribosome biogenesis protein
MRRRITDSHYKSGRDAPAPSAADVLAYLEQRFGLERSLFADYGLYAASKGRLYLGPKRLVNHPRIATAGLLIGRSGNAIKPSTNLLQLFGRHVKKNIVALEKDNARGFMAGEDVKTSGSEARGATDGYVLVKYLDFPLGCGFLQDGRVKNMLPKAKRLAVDYL